MDAQTSWKPKAAGLHEKIAKGEAVTGHAKPEAKDLEKAVVDIVPVSSTGTAVFLAAVASGYLLGVSPVTLAVTLGRTYVRMVPAIAAILCMLSLGFVTKYSGMDAVLGLAFTRTGPLLYPIFGTMLGWLGVALTGSDTSSNVLFGNLQKITAKKLGLNPVLMASANTTGGVMGKMIDAQSIVVAAAATGEGGRKEGCSARCSGTALPWPSWWRRSCGFTPTCYRVSSRCQLRNEATTKGRTCSDSPARVLDSQITATVGSKQALGPA